MINTILKTQFENQSPAIIDKAAITFVQEEKNLTSPQRKNSQLDMKGMADAIKEANVVDATQAFSMNEVENAKNVNDSTATDKKTKLQKAEENLRAAEDKLEKAIDTLNKKQEKVNNLKEKMRNTKNIFKKAGFAIAYGCATAGLKIAELAVKAAAGYVKLLRNIVEKLREKESQNS